MGDTIRTKDGKVEYIGRDRHFQDLLREYIGDDASRFYEDRITELTDLLDELKSLLDTDLAHRDLDEAILLLREDVDKVRWDA